MGTFHSIDELIKLLTGKGLLKEMLPSAIPFSFVMTMPWK